MAKPKYVVKMSKNAKPFMSRVSRHNRAQMLFARKIGVPVGNCIKALEEGRSFTLGEKKQHIAQCQAQAGVKKGMVLGKIDPNSYYWRSKEGRVGGGQTYSKAGVVGVIRGRTEVFGEYI